MLKNVYRLCVDQQKLKICKACLSTQTEKWDLLTSVCLERKPVITPPLNEIEQAFQKYLAEVELERSLKSDHEMRHEKDKKQAQLLKSADSHDLDLDAASLQTAQDFEDACNEELSKFQFASRTTEADKTNDIKSLRRKLDKHLVLLTQQQLGANKYFLPPQGLRNDGETLRQTAERILKESCGEDLKVQFVGNAPAGFYKYRYPKDVQKKGAVGAKVFIYFARHLQGQVTDQSNYKWMDRLELSKEMPKEYHTSLSKLLIDERL